ncbi:MAG: hypothetical protein PVH88_25065 [Ignavibacteria bacterium]
MKKILISIITSEKTWSNFSRFEFDRQIKKLRERFDFAVVLNGYYHDAVNFYAQFKPEYFFLRPNIGYDPAAIEHLFKLIPVYKTTLLLHDDHWFEDENWFIKIENLRNEKPEIDVWGNLVLGSTSEVDGYKEYCDLTGLTFLKDFSSLQMLQGMSGIFSENAIRKIKSVNFNFPLINDKYKAEIGERIFSNLIKFKSLKMNNFPDGIFKFLMHGDDNFAGHLLWTAHEYYSDKKFEKSIEMYEKYIAAKKDCSIDMLAGLYLKLSSSYLNINNVQKSREYFEKAKSIKRG